MHARVRCLFEQALDEEREHLQRVRQWYQNATLAEARMIETA
jgi:hypothetical protein